MFHSYGQTDRRTKLFEWRSASFEYCKMKVALHGCDARLALRARNSQHSLGLMYLSSFPPISRISRLASCTFEGGGGELFVTTP